MKHKNWHSSINKFSEEPAQFSPASVRQSPAQKTRAGKDPYFLGSVPAYGSLEASCVTLVCWSVGGKGEAEGRCMCWLVGGEGEAEGRQKNW